MSKVDLSKFNNDWYQPGGSSIKRLIWYFANACFFKSSFPINALKVFLLKLFGAKLSDGVVIKPGVNIKYPWKLSIGANTWIGENVWIDNLDEVSIGKNCCISQGAMLLCGNHNYKKVSFDLIVKPIVLKDGAWVGAKATVCPCVTMEEHSILTVGSILTSNAEAFGIYSGNPALLKRKRVIES